MRGGVSEESIQRMETDKVKYFKNIYVDLHYFYTFYIRTSSAVRNIHLFFTCLDHLNSLNSVTLFVVLRHFCSDINSTICTCNAGFDGDYHGKVQNIVVWN